MLHFLSFPQNFTLSVQLKNSTYQACLQICINRNRRRKTFVWRCYHSYPTFIKALLTILKVMPNSHQVHIKRLIQLKEDNNGTLPFLNREVRHCLTSFKWNGGFMNSGKGRMMSVHVSEKRREMMNLSMMVKVKNNFRDFKIWSHFPHFWVRLFLLLKSFSLRPTNFPVSNTIIRWTRFFNNHFQRNKQSQQKNKQNFHVVLIDSRQCDQYQTAWRNYTIPRSTVESSFKSPPEYQHKRFSPQPNISHNREKVPNNSSTVVQHFP